MKQAMSLSSLSRNIRIQPRKHFEQNGKTSQCVLLSKLFVYNIADTLSWFFSYDCCLYASNPFRIHLHIPLDISALGSENRHRTRIDVEQQTIPRLRPLSAKRMDSRELAHCHTPASSAKRHRRERYHRDPRGFEGMEMEPDSTFCHWPCRLHSSPMRLSALP